MKILDEFMAPKYFARHGVSIACARPAVVFGHGRKRGSVLWAEDFATQPALGRIARLPFSQPRATPGSTKMIAPSSGSASPSSLRSPTSPTTTAAQASRGGAR